MRIELEGTTFCVTGNFNNHQNTRTVEAALRAKGGKIQKSMGLKVEVLVFGYGYSRKTETAKDRGLPVLREAELDKLLADGFVEVDFEAPTTEGGDASVDELLGEARGALAKSPGPRTWGEIVRIVDQCDADQVGALTDYVFDHLERWPERERLLCAPPTDWIATMMRGEDSPAYRLVRRLDLGEVDAKTTAFKKVLGCESLRHVEALDIAVAKKLTKTAFSALAKAERFATVRDLTVGYFEEDWARALDDGDAMANLHTLGCYPGIWRTRDEWYDALFATKACEGVERLVLYTRSGWGSDSGDRLARLADDALLPSFSHLEIDFVRYGHGATAYPINFQTIDWSVGRAGPDFGRRVQTLTLRTPVTGFYNYDARLDLSVMPELRELRLFDAGLFRQARTTQEDVDRVFHVDRMLLPEALERIVTNVPIDRGAFARLAEKRPELELVQDPSEHLFTP
jgi:hypothetical protein